MTKFNNLTLFKLYFYSRATMFWFPIIVDYFLYLGIGESSVFNLVAWYSIVVVISEFPTGVIGDRFSHKLSVMLGLLVATLSIVTLLFRVEVWIYFLAMTFFGLGVSLISGSDVAILHTISKNFDKDYKSITSNVGIVNLIGIASGGFLYVLNRRLPFILTILFYILALGFVSLIKKESTTEQSDQSSNIYKLVGDIKKQIFSNQSIRQILILFGISSGFFYSYKWFFNPLFEVWSVPLFWYGVLSAGTIIFRIIGVKISGRIKLSPASLLIITTPIIILTAIINIPIISITLFLLSFLLWGVIDTELILNLNKNIKNSQRASMNSLSSLLLRLFSAALLAYSGFLSNFVNIQGNLALSVLTTTALLIGSISILNLIKNHQ